jgi:hypothetical protein
LTGRRTLPDILILMLIVLVHDFITTNPFNYFNFLIFLDKIEKPVRSLVKKLYSAPHHFPFLCFVGENPLYFLPLADFGIGGSKSMVFGFLSNPFADKARNSLCFNRLLLIIRAQETR